MSLTTKNNIIAVIGKSYSGKTTTIINILKESIDYFDGICIIFNGGAVANQFSTIYEQHPSIVPLRNSRITRKAARTKNNRFLEIVEKHKTEIILYDGDSINDYFDGIVELQTKYKVLCVVDELCKVTSLHNAPRTLISIADNGRHALHNQNGAAFEGMGTSIIAGFRRTQAIHKGFFAQIKEMFLHRITSKNDYKIIIDNLGEDVTYDEVKDLGKGDFLRFTEGNLVEPDYFCEFSENMSGYGKIEESEEDEEDEESEEEVEHEPTKEPIQSR